MPDAAIEIPISSSHLQLDEQRQNTPARSVLKFVSRIIKDRNLYGALAFAETAESLRLNIAALQVSSGDNVLGITASGDLLLSLLASSPKAVVGFDANKAQTAISHLKVTSILTFSVEDYKRFMGILPMPANLRLQLLNRISRALPFDSRREILKMTMLTNAGILNSGMSHTIVELLSAIARVLMTKDTAALFFGERGNNQERLEKLLKIKSSPLIRYALKPFLRRLAPRLKWLLFPHRFCDISNRPEEIIYDFFTVFQDLLVQGIRANPVLCRPAVGALHKEWDDCLYNENTFTQIRNNISRLSLSTENFTHGLKQMDGNWATRVYLSNMPDYLSDEQLTDLVKEVKRVTVPGARILYYSLYDKDLLQDLGPTIPHSELKALRDSDDVLVYPTIMVRTRG
jgi:hypothetical protein